MVDAIEVIGFEKLMGWPCAVYLATQITSGKRKQYSRMERAVRVGSQWFPVGRARSMVWCLDTEGVIQGAYDDARSWGLDAFFREAAA